MIKKYNALLKLQFYNFFGVNRLIHSHDHKKRGQFVIIAFVFITIAGIISYVNYIFSDMMAKVGLAECIPIFILILYSLIILFLTFLKGTGGLIGSKDYDIVMSLPVNNITIVLSRLSVLYLVNLVVGGIIIGPAMFIYGKYKTMGWQNYVILSIAFLFAALIPMILSLLVNIIIVSISTVSKHKNLVALFLSTLGIVMLIYFSFKIQIEEKSTIILVSSSISNLVEKYYFPAYLFSDAIEHSDWVSLMWFVGINIVIAVAFVGLVAYWYKKLNTIVLVQHTHRKAKIRTELFTSQFTAMYKKELKRFFSCTIYALNSSIVIILLFVITCVGYFFMPKTIITTLQDMGILDIVVDILPLLISAFVSICCTTSASLSLEGKSRWIMCSIPVQPIVIFNAKIAVNLTIVLPVLWLSLIFINNIFTLKLTQTILLFAVPTVITFFISIMGMFFNIKFPRYDWTSEYYAIKGGALSVLLTIGIGVVVSVCPLYLCIFLGKYSEIIISVVAVLVLLGTILLYRRIKALKEVYM